MLCEKPMAINEREVREMITAAAKKGVFLMEGMSDVLLEMRIILLDEIMDTDAMQLSGLASSPWYSHSNVYSTKKRPSEISHVCSVISV